MKTAIVTGATGNLGSAVAEKLINDGYYTIGTSTGSESKPQRNYEEIKVDLENEAEAGQFVTNVVNRQGGIDLAVLTVGGFAMGNIFDTTSDQILKQYHLNFATAYHVARPVFKQMTAQGHGRIFLVGSKPGLAPGKSKGTVAYALAKSLIFRLAEILNEESTGLDITTTVIVPSVIDTPQNRKSMPNADFSKWVSADDIAETISFYSSDKGASIREPIIKIYNRS